MAAHAGTRTRLKKELFKKKEKVLEDKSKEPEVKDTSDTVAAAPQEVSDTPQEPKSEEPSAHIASDETKEATQKTSDEETGKEDDDSKQTLKKRLMWAGLLLVYIVILASGGYFMYQVGVRKGEESAKKQMEQQIAKAAEPTPTTAPIDKTQFKIKVLNGSGIAGEAAKAKDLLESAGYTVLSVGNAGSQDNTDTTIEAKDTVADTFMTVLKETLEKNYKLGEVKSLAAVDPADIIVTLGGKK